jgi:DNA-binding NarL/FixJ family response regulator
VKTPEIRLPTVLLVEFDSGAARRALTADFDLNVRAVSSFVSARQELAGLRVDAVVVAFDDPYPEALNDFKAFGRGAAAPILVLSRPLDEQRVTELIKGGAAGLLFAEDASRLPVAVRELVRGGVPMSSPVSRLVLGRARRSSSQMAAVRPQTAAVSTLITGRQREILTLLGNGHSYDDIGVALNLSVNTVRTHVRTLYERLGVSTKVEAVVVALELGLLDRFPLR